MKNTKRILWIEEETKNALTERMQYIKSNYNLQVDICKNYQDFLNLSKSKLDQYDVIIVDILIPKNNLSDELDTYGINIIRELNINGKSKIIGIYTNEIWEALVQELENIVPKNRFLQKSNCRSNKMFEEFILRIANL